MAPSKLLIAAGLVCVTGVGLVLATQPGPEANPLTRAEAETRFAALKDSFEPSALVGTPSIVECTLSGGTQTLCAQVSVLKTPKRDDMGPWCPTHVDDGPDKGGIWLDKADVHDVDGAFLANLPTFYDDPEWAIIDKATGKVRVTDTREACEAAARPDVDPQYQNHCVECQPSYIAEDETMTYTIPLRPVTQAAASGRVARGGAGLTLSGLRLDGPAPVDAILGAHTIAPFDDCGGHVNPHAGYHIHAVTDCISGPLPAGDAHAPVIGIALDGFAIHARLDGNGEAPSDLDACRGHASDELGYHYHVNAPGENAILGCHTAETGCSLDDPKGVCDASGGVFNRIVGLFR